MSCHSACILFNRRNACWFGPALAVLLCSAALCGASASNPRLNVLLITVDDMNYDSLGVTGCKIPNISPNIDRLASQGMLFERAHVTIAVCQPTRAVWMTGRYPFRNGARGFEPIRDGIVTLPELLKLHGYFNALVGKASHTVPERHSAFDEVVGKINGRDPDTYYRTTLQLMKKATALGRPFFLMANSHDPHRPFAGSDQEKSGDMKSESRVEVSNPYRPNQVTVPGFLPDLPGVRLEMSEYYTSVRRADQTVGAVLRALRDAGVEENTIVMFLSDHGMALPFAKTNCYYYSTRTPWIVAWPGTTRAGAVERDHFISGIDLMPTVLDALHIPAPQDVDGRSFLPLLHGGEQSGREKLYTVFHKTSGKTEYEMRAAHDKRFLYIFSAWSDGETIFRNESQSGRTMKAMKEVAATNAQIAERVKLFLYRVPEELYDYQSDPDCLNNLVDAPHYAGVVQRLRRQMADEMRNLGDSLRETFLLRTAGNAPAGP